MRDVLSETEGVSCSGNALTQMLCTHEHATLEHNQIFTICLDCGMRTYIHHDLSYTEPITGMKFVYIDVRKESYEPYITSNLTDFWIGTYHLTRKMHAQLHPLLMTFRAQHKHKVKDIGNRGGVNYTYYSNSNVPFKTTYFEWVDICTLLTEMSDTYHYSIPTWDEWFYVCTAHLLQYDLPLILWNTFEELRLQEWCYTNRLCYTQDVGLLLPNDYGLYDVLGNCRTMTIMDNYRYCCGFPQNIQFSIQNLKPRLYSKFKIDDALSPTVELATRIVMRPKCSIDNKS